MKIVSGMRPTGKLHLGHYLGVIKNWLKLQEENQCYFFIADWHALTNKYKETKNLRENIKQMIIDWLSCGISPDKATLFIQSGVKQHAELSLLFSMITPKSWLELNPSYKDLKFNLMYQYIKDFLTGKQIKINQAPPPESYDEALEKATGKQKNKIFEEYLREAFHRTFYSKNGVDLEYLKEVLTKFGIQKKIVDELISNLKDGNIGKEIDTVGFLSYPVLQAADILIYKAQKVPVGEDQLPHIELTREIARRFNKLYKEIFPEPEALLTEEAKLLGIDGRKMSKSYNNAIYLSDSEEEVSQKVLQMKTDPQRVRKTDPGKPENCIVYDYHKIFTKDNNLLIDIDTKCRNAQIGCVECKKILAESLNNFLTPIREKRKEIENEFEKYEKVFIEGTLKCREIAENTMKEVREAMNLYGNF
jgi:tryptophanyl-tRNA synthetase